MYITGISLKVTEKYSLAEHSHHPAEKIKSQL
jgi:hypothetical protein